MQRSAVLDHVRVFTIIIGGNSGVLLPKIVLTMPDDFVQRNSRGGLSNQNLYIRKQEKGI